MKHFFTRKWLFTLFLLSVFTLITDNNISKLSSLINQGEDSEKAIQFCPAYPGLIKAKNPDETTVSFYLKGDEVLHWQVTPDGYTLLENEKGYYCYATHDINGNLVPSADVASDAKSKSGLSIPKNLFFSKSQIKKAIEIRKELFQPIASLKTTSSKTKGFTTGVRKVLVLLIDFKDRPFTHSRQEYDDLMNLEGYNGTGSFKDYYKAVSYNQLICETSVKGPYHANGTMAKYGSNINGNKYINAKLLVQEAVDAAESDGVNFADYDNDGDGYVDAVIVVHSNNDEAQGAGSNAIWSHQSALRYSGMERKYDGVTIDLYNIDPGVTGASGDAMGTIGVFCHEFGHALGLPDTYDIDYSGALTPGNWDVMDGGAYNNNSQTPSFHNPWGRTKLGWQAPVVISNPAIDLTLADCSTSKDLYRVNTQTKGEYYILENRQQTGYNKYVYGHGLLIWHIDSTYISTAGNGVNTDPAHQGVAIVRANGVASNSGANTFPGTASITSFTDETTPSMKAYDGRRVYKPISNIQEATGTISLDFGQGLPATDAGVTAVINPKSGLPNANGFDVTAKLKNFGSAAISNFSVSYKLDTGSPVTETYTNSIEPGAVVEYTFTTKVTIPIGNHTIEVTTAASGDAISENNKATKSVSIIAVSSFPFSENFEGTFPPTSWKVLNPDEPNATWVQKTAIGINGTSTKTVFIDYWTYGGTKDYLLTPAIDLNSASAPTLTFNYAYHKTNSDGLSIQVSTDYGETFATIWEKYGEDLATVPSTEAYNIFTPTAGNQWKTVNIGLGEYVGKNVVISFTGISANGDNIYIDDVSVGNATCTPPTSPKNFSVTNLTKNSSTINWERGDGNGVIVLQRNGQNVDGTPQNATQYSVGDMIGNSKVIYVGDATSHDITSLTPVNTYYFAVYEKSNTNCYSTSPITGNFTTLGLASVKTVTVTDLQTFSATIVGNVTNLGEAPVTERGICFSTNYNALGVNYDHLACQSGFGEFEAKLTNLNPATYYYVVAYAKNIYGVAYGNVVTFYTVGGCDKLNYGPEGFSIISGTYTDITTDPNSTTITTANFDAANSLPINIGFDFKYNCNTYSKFVLNTNGFIVLGDHEPSKADLHPKASTAAANCNADGVFFSTDSRDINIISPYNHNLKGGTNAGYSILITGSEPNRVATIQFKNLVDNLGTASQFSAMNFQIKLYETSSIIEFVYGTFTAHPTNADAYTLPVVGLKGYSGQGTNSSLNQQILKVAKSSSTAWSNPATVAASIGSYTYQSAGAFGTKKSVLPTSGLTYRFVPKVTTDIAISEIYALTKVPANAGSPQTVSADITNNGTNDAVNIAVTLEVTGINTFTAPIIIPFIGAGNTRRITFPVFYSEIEDICSIKVFVAAGDMNSSNDSKTVSQLVSPDTYSYTVGSSPSTAYSSPNITAVKYHVNGTRIIKTVSAFIFNTPSNSGKSSIAYVLDANGNIIGESNPVTFTLGEWNNFPITVPPTVTNTDFYVGINATSVGSSYPVAAQAIYALNTGVNVVIPIGGGKPSDFSAAYRFMISAVIDIPAITDKPVVITNNDIEQPSNTEVVVSGNVTDDKGAAISSRGFYWSTSSPVTTSSSKVEASSQNLGSMTETITGLTPGNTYYYAAYAHNSNGTTLGDEKSFVKKSSQTISFGTLTDMKYEDADIELNATTTSNLPIIYTSSNLDVATIIEDAGKSYIHVVGVGVCNITASQSGDATYAKAADVKQSLTINKKTITVTIPDLSRTFNYNPQEVAPTPANYKYIVTYNGSKYAPVDVASYTVIATIDDENYEGTATETLVVGKANSTITFNAIPTKGSNESDFFPDATASSGLMVTLASENTNVATIVNGNIHIVGVGTSKITASLASTANFNAPAPQDQILTVTDRTKPVITLLGNAVVNITTGTTYNDAGATAIDNVDGTITSSIVVTGIPANTNTIGQYIVHYNVTDLAGNAADEVIRTINITQNTSVNPNDIANVRIYSNSQTIFVDLPEINGSARIEVFNILGNKVYSNLTPTVGINKVEENLSAGAYIIKVIVDKEVKTQKVVINR